MAELQNVENVFLFTVLPPDVTSAQNRDKSCVQELEEKFSSTLFQLLSPRIKTKPLHIPSVSRQRGKGAL
jgi:hypothetical protein